MILLYIIGAFCLLILGICGAGWLASKAEISYQQARKLRIENDRVAHSVYSSRDRAGEK